MEGKVSAAMQWMGENATGILEPTPDAIKVLKEKASLVSKGKLSEWTSEEGRRVIFGSIDKELIRQAAEVRVLQGLPGMDAYAWNILLCSKPFDKKCEDLYICYAI